MKAWHEKVERRVLDVLDEKEGIRTTTQIRVMEWIGGKGTYRMVEKRDVFFNRDGTQRDGKCRGFNASDFQLIIYHKDRILKHLLGQT